MTIDEAIERLDEQKYYSLPPRTRETVEAIRLGIEALKRLQVIRGYPHYQWKQLLPGETE